MERGFVITDVSGLECLSPSELDRRFIGEHSLLLSGTSVDKVSVGPEAKPAVLTSVGQSSFSSSPSQAFTVSSLTSQETFHTHLAVPLQDKSSTPHGHQPAAPLDQSYIDLNAWQTSWDVSLIKADGSSPKPCTESSASESTLSPKPLSAPGSLAEISSLM